ncbi:MAG TPA: family 43 glycosylhydrolase [Pyrinomonadaceae bacterium]|jgi:beta-xylosidase
MNNLRCNILSIKATLTIILLALCLTSVQAQQRAVYENPVIAGDFPDPSVIRVGQDYWATTTSGEWAPEFPILHSRDLVNWEIVGAVFQKRPAWANNSFWAPEIAEHRGRYFVYYTARKKNGPLCVAVASAAKPVGPYTDHGPLVCQDIGSIDAMAATDERGERYLVWKEDGNSREQPTPMWAQKLDEAGTKLVGGKKELFRNDPKSWEGGVVEGAFILRRKDWFYLFYSGNACCGRRCNYALGVARSRKLLGPWEKNPANPILAENQEWQCPGHGSITTDEQGRDYLLYHAYRQGEQAFYIGREALLDEITWGADGWPKINDGKGPTGRAPAPLNVAERNADESFFDEFDSPTLRPSWQWPQANEPSIRIEIERGGRLVLTSVGNDSADSISAILSQPTTSANYVATTLVDTSAMKQGALAGLSAYNGRDDALGIAAGDGKIHVYVRENKKHRVVKTMNAPQTSPLYLRMNVSEGWRYRFAFSSDGREWKEFDDEINGSFLEGVRVALTAGGSAGATARFEWLRIKPAR